MHQEENCYRYQYKFICLYSILQRVIIFAQIRIRGQGKRDFTALILCFPVEFNQKLGAALAPHCPIFISLPQVEYNTAPIVQYMLAHPNHGRWSQISVMYVTMVLVYKFTLRTFSFLLFPGQCHDNDLSLFQELLFGLLAIMR